MKFCLLTEIVLDDMIKNKGVNICEEINICNFGACYGFIFSRLC